MDVGLGVIVLLLGLGVGFLSGLLGIGGGVILTPLLLYLPPLLGVGHLDMREVAGLTMVQGLSAAASGVLRHHRYGFVCRSLVACMGTTIAMSSLLGAVLSRFVQAQVLLAVFATLALAAALLMLTPRPEADDTEDCTEVRYSRALAVGVAAVVGGLGGLVGQGGAFILVPLMLYLLRLPTRITLGSSLGIIFFSALASFIGKLGTGQIHLPLAALLALGAVPGAQVGGYASRHVHPRRLRQLLAVLIGMTALKMWQEVGTALLAARV